MDRRSFRCADNNTLSSVENSAIAVVIRAVEASLCSIDSLRCEERVVFHKNAYSRFLKEPVMMVVASLMHVLV